MLFVFSTSDETGKIELDQADGFITVKREINAENTLVPKSISISGTIVDDEKKPRIASVKYSLSEDKPPHFERLFLSLTRTEIEVAHSSSISIFVEQPELLIGQAMKDKLDIPNVKYFEIEAHQEADQPLTARIKPQQIIGLKNLDYEIDTELVDGSFILSRFTTFEEYGQRVRLLSIPLQLK